MRKYEHLLFTVFTPTFNRAHLLHRVFSSLQEQTFQDFEWLIVDDGSTDNTRELVEQWAQESTFPIRYFYQENQHKKTAFNKGVAEAKCTLFLPWDSDDTAVPEALEVFADKWAAIPAEVQDKYVGVTGLCIYETGKIVGDRFPTDELDSDSLETRYRYRIKGEKWGFQRIDVLKKFPFPQHVSGLVPEGFIWSKIARSYKTRYINAPLRIYHQEEDSITAKGRTSGGARERSEGAALFYSDALNFDMHWFPFARSLFARNAANYIRYSLHMKSEGKNAYRITNWQARLLCILTFPLGFALYLRDNMRR